MPAPRKPTGILEASGAYKKNPQRRRDPEPKPSGKVGPPPTGLTDGAMECWAEIIATCGGWLTDADQWSVEIAARLMDKFRRNDISGVELGNLRAITGALGMNPADRSKISIVKEKPANAFADLAEEARNFSRPN